MIVFAAFAGARTSAEEKTTALSKDSPFNTANTPAAATAPGETLEFAGVSSVGKKTQLIFHDRNTKKNRWIGIGETVDDISVLNYDSRLEQAVVRVNGMQKILPLRKGSGPLNAPNAAALSPGGFTVAPLPAPPLPHASTFNKQPATVQAQPMSVAPVPAPAPAPSPAANTPEAIARQEQEARMLVSDLLEIGMAQRKAYEEAQRRAAEGKAQSNPPQQPGTNP